MALRALKGPEDDLKASEPGEQPDLLVDLHCASKLEVQPQGAEPQPMPDLVLLPQRQGIVTVDEIPARGGSVVRLGKNTGQDRFERPAAITIPVDDTAFHQLSRIENHAVFSQGRPPFPSLMPPAQQTAHLAPLSWTGFTLPRDFTAKTRKYQLLFVR
jgi:hypothetical protein